MKLGSCVLGLLALAGCATQAPLPVMPTITDVAAAQSQLSTVTDPQGFFRTAAAQIMANCGGYFDQLVAIAQRNAQTSSQLTGATQALSAILGMAQAAPGPIAVLGVVGPAVTGAIANAQAGMPGGDHPAETSTLVAAMMNSYLTAIGNPPTDAPSAWLAAYGLFRTCSPAGIEAAKQQALADAPNHLEVVGTPGPPSSAVPEALVPEELAPRAAPPTPERPMSVPLVRVHTRPRAAPAVVAQAIPNPQIRKMHAWWRATQQNGGRNAAEGGARSLPYMPPPMVMEEPTPAPMPPEVHPLAGPLPPPLPAPPEVTQPTLPDRNFFGAR